MMSGSFRIFRGRKRRRIVLLLILVITPMGFLLSPVLYESLCESFFEVGHTIATLPVRWYVVRNSWKFMASMTSQEPNMSKIWEEPTLLSINNFSWIRNNPDICKVNDHDDDPNESWILPILVFTARNHFGERDVMRKTLGSISRYKKWIIRLVFLLGEAEDSLEDQLNDEWGKYGDIITGSFTDSYRNLTYKHLMGYKWILNFCPEASFVIRIDDDIFIDMFTWLKWRSADLEGTGAGIHDRLYCRTYARHQPNRGKGKWHASLEDWPDDYYPDYCNGLAYGISVDLIRKLYSVANDIKFFWIEDVFVTGALMEVAKRKYHIQPRVKHIWRHVTPNTMIYKSFCENGSTNKKRPFDAVAFVNRGKFFERDMMCLWNKTLYDYKINMHTYEPFVTFQ